MSKVRLMYKIAGIGALIKGMLLTNTVGTLSFNALAGGYEYVNELYKATSGMSPEQAQQVPFFQKILRRPREPGRVTPINYQRL